MLIIIYNIYNIYTYIYIYIIYMTCSNEMSRMAATLIGSLLQNIAKYSDYVVIISVSS